MNLSVINAGVLLIALSLSTSSLALEGGGFLAGAGSAAGGRQWPTFNNDYAGQRFSYLAQIDKTNVAELTEVCRVEVADGGSFQAGPILVDGVMYVTTHLDTIALDPATCKVLWKSHYEPVAYEPFTGNRGVGHTNGRLFRGTTDGHLLAMDARTGALLWNNKIADSSIGECVAAAPVGWNGVVIIGTGCGDWGARGRVLAFDALTGRELWRFNTIPTGDERGADTWDVPPGKFVGGGGTWSTFTIDVSTGELFVPVGNPAPDLLPDERPGDNLFTNSIVVLDVRTGALKWWFQAVKNDPWDYDMAAAPMLYRDKAMRPIMAAAGKDGHVYRVDRATHELLSKTAVTTQKKTAPKPTPEGALTCPGSLGGTQWNGPAYDDLNHAVVVGAVDWCTTMKAGKVEPVRGMLFLGGDLEQATEPAPSGWITSLDAESGAVRWKYKTDAPVVAAVTPTAGGVIFAGDTAGNFLALDSASGAVLLRKPLNAAIGGGIITYSVEGKQYVATTAGNVSRVTFGGTGTPSIIVMSAGEAGKSGRSGSAPQDGAAASASGAHGAPAAAAASPGTASTGQALYGKLCAACHGPTGAGGVGPTLRGVSSRLSAEQTMEQIKNPRGTMPRMYPGSLTDQDVSDLTSFIRTL
jgi:alcohol dehydrogenase (cytochrome c)